MRTFAVVVTYNRKELLRECLDMILAQTCPVDKLILIDNASTDGTGQMLTEGGYLDNPVFDYRLMENNLGGAGGFYEGLRIAGELGADWVWIMDDDTIPQEDSLAAIMSKTGQYPNAGFFASCVMGPDGEPMNIPVIDKHKADNGYEDWYMPMKDGMVKIQTATFVSLLINGKAIKKCGLPCKDFFIWGDDTEYTLRLTRHYGNAYLVGESWVCHKRFNAKCLGVQFEDDKKRLRNYHYLYRNTLIRAAKYDGGLYCALKLFKFELLSFRVLFFRRNGIHRFKAVQKGIFEFMFQYKKFSRFIDGELQGN